LTAIKPLFPEFTGVPHIGGGQYVDAALKCRGDDFLGAFLGAFWMFFFCLAN
jgi:hypothetical protein